METCKEKRMLLLILRAPIVFQTIAEILTDLHIESIALSGYQVAGPEEEQMLAVPMVGGFLRLLEKDAPDSKAVLAVMEDDVMIEFEKRCEGIYGNLAESKEFMALVLPVIRTLGSRFEFAV